jgi:hypothetical protein
VAAVSDRKTFAFEVTADPGPFHVHSWYYGFLGVSFQGASVDGGSAGVLEANRVFHCRVGGPYHDTWSTRSVLARDNHFNGVVVGPFQSMGGAGGPMPPASLTANHQAPGDGKTATFTTSGPHGLQVGQAVIVSNVEFEDGGIAPEGTYNGKYVIAEIPHASQFTYRMAINVGDDARSNVGTARALWTVGWSMAENNVVDLIPTINFGSPPIALLAAVYSFLPAAFNVFYPFKALNFSKNVIRYVDGRGESVETPAQAIWMGLSTFRGDEGGCF